jgi:predicted negative regulator of RcsB-dependent stress response
MVKVSKQRAKELKAPDQFQVKAAGMVDWLVLNKKQLLIATVPLVLIIVLGFAYSLYSNQQDSQRIAALGKVQLQFEEEAKKAEDLKQVHRDEITKIEEQLAALKEDDEAGKAKLEAQKKELNEKIEAIEADHTDSREAFAQFGKEHSNSPQGWMASVTAAKLYIGDGKFDEAQGLLTSVIENSKGVMFYQIHARFILVGILEDQQKFDEALKLIDELEKIADKDLKPQVLLAKGRVQILKKSSPDAIQTLTKLIDDFGTSPQAQKARSMRALLN